VGGRTLLQPRAPEKELASIVQTLADWLAARGTAGPKADDGAVVLVTGVHERLSKLASQMSKAAREGSAASADDDAVAAAPAAASTAVGGAGAGASAGALASSQRPAGKKEGTLVAGDVGGRPPLTPAPKKTVRRRKAVQEAPVGGGNGDALAAKPAADADESPGGRRRSSSFDVSKKVARTNSMLTLADSIRAAPPGPHEDGEGEAAPEADDAGAPQPPHSLARAHTHTRTCTHTECITDPG
jgi:hypothetical protein